MKLSKKTLISYEKLTKYLLISKKRNDKSKWLSKAGYTIENWRVLLDDLKNQVLPLDAKLIENSVYGQLYEIRSKLKGPIGIQVSVCTIWMIEKNTGLSKFITMFPDKDK